MSRRAGTGRAAARRALCLAVLLAGCSHPPAGVTPPRWEEDVDIDERELPAPTPVPPAAEPSVPARAAGARSSVRVGLLVEQRQVEAHALGEVEVGAPAAGLLASLHGEAELSVRAWEQGLELRADGQSTVRTPETSIRLTGFGHGPRWRVKDNQYGGDLLALRGDGGNVTLVNVVDLEEYLRGVVPWEIGRPGPEALEAVKAQAVAARTYTLAHMGQWEQLGFDMYDSVSDQVYRGLTGTADITDRSVSDTRGLVMRYQGQLILAYYSSTCGGHTSTIDEVWPKARVPYLIGQRDAADGGPSWCADSPHYRWTTAWSARELGDVLRRSLPAELGRQWTPERIGRLRRLDVVERDGSGRVRRLAIVTDRTRVEVVGDRIRWVLVPKNERYSILRSTMFDVENVERDGVLVAVRLRGAGFGHGVGLCQSGALGMARAGYDARQILAHYYPGTQVEAAFDDAAVP